MNMEELLRNEDFCDELTENNLEKIAGGCNAVWFGVHAGAIAVKAIMSRQLPCGGPRTR